jgi:hypothetical protein
VLCVDLVTEYGLEEEERSRMKTPRESKQEADDAKNSARTETESSHMTTC